MVANHFYDLPIELQVTIARRAVNMHFTRVHGWRKPLGVWEPRDMGPIVGPIMMRMRFLPPYYHILHKLP